MSARVMIVHLAKIAVLEKIALVVTTVVLVKIDPAVKSAPLAMQMLQEKSVPHGPSVRRAPIVPHVPTAHPATKTVARARSAFPSPWKPDRMVCPGAVTPLASAT